MLWACPCTGLSMLWAPRSRSSSRTSPGPRCPSGGHENPHLPVPAQGATEKLAIFGPRRGRRGAELKVMAAVETKVRSGAPPPPPENPPTRTTHRLASGPTPSSLPLTCAAGRPAVAGLLQ